MIKREIKSILFDYNSLAELDEKYQELIQKAKEAAENAYAPYSKFNVGAAVLLENNEIIQGNNQENAAYPSGLCAERVAIFYANSKYPNIPIKAIAVTASTEKGFITDPIPPCGSCLQVILESEKRSGKPIEVLLYGQNKITIADSVIQFLPLYFNKEMLK
ncbi:MAG TPA: cytidine deaminase [Bacteroidales bacterium]|jgi:cytidine deaminase|nr:cytidine deaminase [Bacteroidales bacterium]